MEFADGTVAFYANELGKIQGRLALAAEWAKLHNGFEMFAPAHKKKLEEEIEYLQRKIEKLRTARTR